MNNTQLETHSAQFDALVQEQEELQQFIRESEEARAKAESDLAADMARSSHKDSRAIKRHVEKRGEIALLDVRLDQLRSRIPFLEERLEEVVKDWEVEVNRQTSFRGKVYLEKLGTFLAPFCQHSFQGVDVARGTFGFQVVGHPFSSGGVPPKMRAARYRDVERIESGILSKIDRIIPWEALEHLEKQGLTFDVTDPKNPRVLLHGVPIRTEPEAQPTGHENS